MKYLKYFEINSFDNSDYTGEYAIVSKLAPTLGDFKNYKIVQIIVDKHKMIPGNDWGYFIVSYDTPNGLMKHRVDSMYIIKHSPNKEDLELYLASKKFNI